MKKLFFYALLALGPLQATQSQNPADSARYLYLEYQEAWADGDFMQSRSLLERIIQEKYPLPAYNLALVHNALGFVCYEMGSVGQALDHYRIADRITIQRNPATIKLKISIYNNLSVAYEWLGDYTSSLSHYDKALRLLDSLPVRDEDYYNKLSMLCFNKGIALYSLERFDEALGLFRQSEQIKEARGHSHLGSVFFNLARLYQVSHHPDLSEQYYRKSMNRWIEESGKDYYQLANVYLHFGLFFAEQGGHEQAIYYFTLALQNYIRNYGPKHPLTAAGYERLANYHLEREDYQQALEKVQLALISVSGEFSDRDIYANPDNARSLHDLTLLKCYTTKTKALEGLAGATGSGSEKIKILDAALDANASAIEVLYILQGSYLSSENRTYLTSGQKSLFSTGIRLNLKQFEMTREKEYKENAFLMAARGKSNELIFGMREKEWLYLGSLTDSLAVKVIELKGQIDHYSNRIQLETQELVPDTSRLAAWQEQLFRCRADFTRHMEQLKREYPQIRHFDLSVPGFSPGWVSQQLERGETLVEYYVSGAESNSSAELYAFIINRKDLQIYHKKIDSSFYLNMDNIILNIHAFNPFTESQRKFESLKSSLFQIYQLIFEPVEPFIRGKNLIIAPDAALALLPFDALISEYHQDTVLNYAGLPYLLNDYNITYVYNSQIIDRAGMPGIALPGINAYVPDYRLSGTAGSSLPGALEEVNNILEKAKGNSLTGALDKEEIQEFINQDRVIHLAMHANAEADASSPPYFLLNTGSDSVLSNRLYDYEIHSMMLSSPMVVLSSCETGSGLLDEGEGILSLSRSFLLAGAASVIHTLWPVEDATVQRIMVDFYGELKTGQSKGSALSMAKKNYLAYTPPSYTHPYYWAGYQVTGNPDPLTINRRNVFYTICILILCLAAFYFIRRSFFSRV